MKGNSEDENEETLDFQVEEDTIQSALAFLGNAATQFSIYRRTKILEEYSKELVSFSEELEPELRAAAPLLFGPSCTKQAADHLGQVEALRKVKGKGKKVFYKAPCRDSHAGRGSKPHYRSQHPARGSSGATPKKPQHMK